jgi:hypothetical protein
MKGKEEEDKHRHDPERKEEDRVGHHVRAT